MALLPAILPLLATFLHLVASRALIPISPVQDGALQLPSPSQLASWDPAILGTSAADPILRTALDSPDPLSVLRNTTKPLGDQVFSCSGDQYGYNLPLQSCLVALMLLPDIPMKLSFGPRTQGKWNFETPYRILSSDGLCAVDLERNSDALSDRVVGHDLVQAAKYLVTECFSESQQGGILRNLGDRGRINLIIRTYTPNVQCSSGASAPYYGTCLNIIGKQVPNDKDVRVFGRAGAPNVRQLLPYTIVDSYTHKCQLTVNTRGPVDNAAWYDIWGAAVAIDAMCGRENKGGIAPGLGERGNIFAILKKYDPRLDGTNVTALEV